MKQFEDQERLKIENCSFMPQTNSKKVHKEEKAVRKDRQQEMNDFNQFMMRTAEQNAQAMKENLLHSNKKKKRNQTIDQEPEVRDFLKSRQSSNKDFYDNDTSRFIDRQSERSISMSQRPNLESIQQTPRDYINQQNLKNIQNLQSNERDNSIFGESSVKH